MTYSCFFLLLAAAAVAAVPVAPVTLAAQSGTVATGGATVPRRGTSAQVRVVPAKPVPGALVRVYVTAPARATVGGTLAGEALHFTRERDGRWMSLGGIPIDSADSVAMRVDVAFSGDTTSAGVEQWADTLERALRLAPPNYRTESLRVAPEYGREPDSALTARLAREAAQAAAVSRTAHETPRLWRGAFALPRPGRVTSPYGSARQFNGQLRSRHMGTDFAGATGAPIKAVNRGVVRLVDRFYLGGNIVYVDHGAGLVTAYLHMSRTDVAVGDTVAKGETIGRVGSTGRVTGPHLHLIVRYGSVTVDPMTLLPKPAVAAPARKPASKPAAKPAARKPASR